MVRSPTCGAPPAVVSIGHRSVSSFFLAGLVGATVSGPLGMILAWKLSLSVGVVAALWVLALATLLGLAKAAQVFTGEPVLVYYRHELAIVALSAAALRIGVLPVLPYLDIVILGIGVFLVFGRLGCLAVGCCHGRPASWGVRYREAHAGEGFAPYLVGVPLVPIQLLESFWTLGIVIVGTVFLLGGAPPGTALVLYTLAYAVGRFAFETVRGDTGRPSLLGLSEAQWVSVVLALAALWGMKSGRLPELIPPAASWVFALSIAAAAVLCAILARSSFRRFTTADHVAELARGIDELRAAAQSGVTHRDATPPVFRTSLGLCVSYGCISSGGTGRLHHYALSWRQLPLSGKLAGLLASLIVRLRHAGRPCELRSSRSAVHVLVPDDLDTLERS